MRRRAFLKGATTLSLVAGSRLRTFGLRGIFPTAQTENFETAAFPAAARANAPRRIPNEYTLFLPGEREDLRAVPQVESFEGDSVTVRINQELHPVNLGSWINGWQLIAILPRLNGIPTAVFEKNVTYQGALVYVTKDRTVAQIPKHVGDLSKIRPRPIDAAPEFRFERPTRFAPGPDKLGEYILSAPEDPCYENVAALGPELIGWTLVANEEGGPQRSLFLEADGRSREFGNDPKSLWAPDLTGRLFDPVRLLPGRYLYEYEYVTGFSKRTLIGGFAPAANIGVWNPHYQTGYEVMVVLPPGEEATPLGRVRALPSPADRNSKQGDRPQSATERYWGGTKNQFYSELVGVWNQWNDFFNRKMEVEIPDQWLLDAARAGITLSRCSYRGLRPSGQVGEGAYTEIPEHGHSFFPVDFYEFIWAQQLWNLVEEAEPYLENYLTNYILPNGNFLYNVQEQVEAPLNTGVFLEISSRAYFYTRDLAALQRRLPVLRRMISFILDRYRYSKKAFSENDPRHGLIWGSAEADNGHPSDDFPESYPYYYQNSSWTWRGLQEHARALQAAGAEHQDATLCQEGAEIAKISAEIRADIERSLKTTLAAMNPAMKAAGITPFTPSDTKRKPTELEDYENHRYMMDWWNSDWGDAALDDGHYKHRRIAGLQLLGMNTDGSFPETTNFMEFGTLAYLIRQDDYRPFLLTLYADACYAMDCGNRYSPENALLPGGYPGEGARYAWSAKVGSEVEPAFGLRWLLCYEEHDHDIVHLQKAAPQHWFEPGEKISVQNCPTRFGHVSWTTTSSSDADSGPRWHVEVAFETALNADLIIHIHPPGRAPLRTSSAGKLEKDRVILPASVLAGKTSLTLDMS